ncbi:MAG TPA: LLM class F420-dependent oxidoreductase [Acidimicrobiales bacterium]|nr:LLM class F420-dependent oxidoreductase [Acidimicrobiales bacterium]
MRLSVVTPVLTRVPGAHARWEQAAGMAEVVEIARAADRLGYHHLTCSEHVAIPTDVAEVRGATYWDPLATFGYLAAVTERIRLATYVLVLGYHHPLEIAKRYGTLDLVSGGRLILGVGVGSLREEFELLGAPFEDRGARGDDALMALRASLSREQPEYHGSHHDYGGFVVRPCAVQPRVPLWVGGRTRRSLRRAATLADGWAPFGVSVAQVADWLGGVDLPDGFEVVISPARALDPSDGTSACADALGALAAAGTTIVAARVVHHSLAHYLEQLEALAGFGGVRRGAV